MTPRPLTVAVVGATGVVGRTMIQVLREREFPLGELRLLASGRSAGSTVSVAGTTHDVGEATPDAFDGRRHRPVLRRRRRSREILAPAAVAHGATVIDNSNAWRMEPGVPLVVSQVNPDDAGTARGDHRQPELLDDAARADAHGAARRGRPRARRRRHVSERVRARAARRSPSSRGRSAPTSLARP